MATFKELYKRLKDGHEFENNFSYVCIGTCDRWGSPSYGKDYIYWQHYGQSANTVSFENFKWIAQTIFKCPTANEFIKLFNEQ